MDPITGGLIVAGTALAGQGVNAFAQGKMNHRTREFSREMYEKQKADNQAFWHMQNEYNNPLSQMERLKSAGLNPNMVYGATAPGNSSGQIHTATPPAWSPKAPQFDGGSVASSYFNTQIMSAQLDNLKATNDKIRTETRAISANAGLRESELQYAPDFFNTRSRKMLHDSELAGQNSMFREQELNSPDLWSDTFRNSPAGQKLISQVENLELETKIRRMVQEGKSLDNISKQLDIDLKKNGINPNDPIWQRIIGRIASKYVDLSNFKFK